MVKDPSAPFFQTFPHICCKCVQNRVESLLPPPLRLLSLILCSIIH